MKYGQMLAAKSLILRIYFGEAKDCVGVKYELSTTPGGTPLVKSGKTGKTFSLSWTDVINMAKAAGVDKSDAAKAAKGIK